MPNAFESGFQNRVLTAANRAFGVLVVFIRGGLFTPEFTARRADREHAALSPDGMPITITMRDFVLPVADLLIDDDPVEPRTGDRILEGDELWEIQPPDQTKPSVELQAGGFEYIVHCKRIT